MKEESDRAAERRVERNADHKVIGYAEHEHSMNGRSCENPWAVMRYDREPGRVAFYCGECGVGVGATAGAMFDDLMDSWRNDS